MAGAPKPTHPDPDHRARGRIAVIALLSAGLTAAQSGNDDPAGSPPPHAPGVTGPPAPAFEPPRPAAAAERQRERLDMVRMQIARTRDGSEPVDNERVLEAMRRVPRHVFVPSALAREAYADSPLPIGYGQTISQPYIVALMTMLLDPKETDRVLEVGTGSGYQAAVLAHLTPHVYTIEIVQPLHERASATLRDQGYGGVRCLPGDGYFGWPEESPFDAIIVTCAAGHLPPPLWEQLRPGGRMVIPIGGPTEVQRLVVLTKEADGSRRSRSVTAVRFVPMTGRVQD
jgi:protein-L-isoaspartate(D-aspartate) O-methyltransferase